MGLLPQGKKQVKFLLITIDYFTKRVEAKALTMITEAKIQNFVWKNIICKFRIPRTIILDNSRQFDSKDPILFAQTSTSKINLRHQDILKPTDK